MDDSAPLGAITSQHDSTPSFAVIIRHKGDDSAPSFIVISRHKGDDSTPSFVVTSRHKGMTRHLFSYKFSCLNKEKEEKR